MNYESARRIVIEEVNKNYRAHQGDQIVLRDEYTITNNYGWIFSYQSQLALKGSFSHRLVGNLPIFISRKSGSMYYLSPGVSIETIVREHES